MIVCAKCGEHIAGETRFCPACGTFLDWSADKAPAREPAAVPAAASAPEPEQPAAMLPADDHQARPRARTTGPRPVADDDVVCVGCRTRNPVSRKLCMGCGRPLDEPEPERPPWWRKLLFWRGKQKRLGDRPRARRRSRFGAVLLWTRNVALLIVAALALVYAVVPGFRTAVNKEIADGRKWVERRFSGDLQPVRPTAVRATASTPGHDALLATDNSTKTYWAAPVTDRPPILVLTFDRPVDLRRAIVRSGDPAKFQETHRPSRLHLVYSTGKTYDVRLADTPEPQTVEIAESAGATSVEVHVADVHTSLLGKDVALTEIELFAQP